MNFVSPSPHRQPLHKRLVQSFPFTGTGILFVAATGLIHCGIYGKIGVVTTMITAIALAQPRHAFFHAQPFGDRARLGALIPLKGRGSPRKSGDGILKKVAIKS